jgi:hypothetical protein
MSIREISCMSDADLITNSSFSQQYRERHLNQNRYICILTEVEFEPSASIAIDPNSHQLSRSTEKVNQLLR